MRILSRAELLCMPEATLRATAECHGMDDAYSIPGSQLLDDFDDYLDMFRAMQEED